jgi:hypothetical protein
MSINKLDKVFSLLAIVGGLMVIVLSITSAHKDNELKKTGKMATATVVRTLVTYKNPKNRTFDSFKDKSVWGIYQFKATNGLVYEVQATTSGATIGNKTTIYYNPANPEQEYYLDSDAYGFFLGLGIGSVITALGVFFYKRA